MDYSKVYNFCLEAYAKIPYLFGGGRAFRPMTLFVELTYRCNFRCDMCQFLPILDDPRLKEKKGEELTTDEIKGVIDDISRLGLISFTGGEPLLRKDMPELLRHACKRHKSYLVTNGLLLGKETSDLLVELGCRNFISWGMAAVGVSLEGLENTHDSTVNAPGTYEKILANTRYLVEAKRRAGKKYPLTALKCVITQNNAHELDEMYRVAEETGVDIFNPITLYNIPSTNRLEMNDGIMPDLEVEPIRGFDASILKDQLEKLCERAKRSSVQLRLTPPGISREDILAVYENRLDMTNKACYSPWSSAAVSAYGDVFPCSNYSVGNIRREPFLTLWNNEKMKFFRKELKKRRIFKSCHSCCSIVAEGEPSTYPHLEKCAHQK